MGNACARCRATDDLSGALFSDESGAVFVELCPRCRSHIDTPRCSACGSRTPAGVNPMHFEDDPGTVFEFCGTCRLELIDGANERIPA